MADLADIDFGRRLRAARERRGLSLTQIARKTKISGSVLEALERNDVSRLPGGIFARAFVRAYAIEVGLDPDQTVQEFVDRFPRAGVGAGQPHAHEQEENQAIENSRRAARTMLTLVLLGLPLAIAIVYFSATGSEQQRTRPVEIAAAGGAQVATSGEQMATPAGAPRAAVDAIPATATPPSAEVEPGPLRVGVNAIRSCWVSARVDGQLSMSRTLPAAEAAVLTATREIVLRVGDASALALTINDAPVAPLGAPGAVVTLRITPDNYRSFLAGR